MGHWWKLLISPATATSNFLSRTNQAGGEELCSTKCALKDFHQWKESRNGLFEQLKELYMERKTFKQLVSHYHDATVDLHHFRVYAN